MPTDARTRHGIVATTTFAIGVLDPEELRRVDTEQFISEYEPEMRVKAAVASILDVGGHPTYDEVVVTSPFTPCLHLPTEKELKGRPFEDRAVEHAEKKRSIIGSRRERKAVVHLVSGLKRVRTWESRSRQGADGCRKKETGKERRTGGNERIQALEIAGSTKQTMHSSGSQQLQKAMATKPATTQSERYRRQADEGLPIS